LLATETSGFLDDACSLLSLIDKIDLGLIQLTAIANDIKLANRDCDSIGDDGRSHFKMDRVTLYNSNPITKVRTSAKRLRETDVLTPAEFAALLPGQLTFSFLCWH
jgi:hypothetical protein